MHGKIVFAMWYEASWAQGKMPQTPFFVTIDCIKILIGKWLLNSE